MSFEDKFRSRGDFPMRPGHFPVESKEKMDIQYDGARKNRDAEERRAKEYKEKYEVATPIQKIFLATEWFWREYILTQSPQIADAQLRGAERSAETNILTKVKQHEYLVRRAELALQDLRQYEEEVLGGATPKNQLGKEA